MCIYVYIHVNVCLPVRVPGVHTSAWQSVPGMCMFLILYIPMYVHMHTCVLVFAWLYIHVHTCLHDHVPGMYTHAHTST